MLHPQLTLPLHRKLVIDNFAGGGGASTGIERALGRPVDHAINHDRLALGMHRINHPQTVHHCEDVFDIDPLVVTEGREVGLGWFSPDCKHFSKAKGGKPLDKRIRGLVLVMLRWAKHAAPNVLMMENVEEITTWCPLRRVKKNGNFGWYPDERYKGRTWKAFLDCLGGGIKPSHKDLPFFLEVLGPSVTKADLVQGMGYHIETRELRGCSYGAPTIRKRLFLVARNDGQPVVWPENTHVDPKVMKRLNKLMGITVKPQPWRTIAECIDWSLPCPSIFLTSEEAKKVRCKRPLAAPSLRRIAKGVDRYVLKAEQPFLVSLTHQGGDRVEAVTDPIRTITGAHRGEKALVAPTLSKFHGDHKGRADGATRNHEVTDPLMSQDTSNRFGLTEATLAPVLVNTANSKTTGRGPNVWPPTDPLRTVTASPSFNLAQAKLAPFITEHAQAANQRVIPANEPCRTLCAEVKGGHFAAVAPVLINTTNGKFDDAPSRNRSVNEPLPPVTGVQKHALITGTLVQTGYGERDGQEPRCLDPHKPLGTIVAGAGKHAVVTGTLVGAGGPEYSGKPTAVDRPFKSQTTENHSALASATLVHVAHGEADTAGKPRRGRGAHDVGEPVPTVTTSKDLAISMVKMRGTNIGDSALSPLHTLSAGGTHHAVLAAYLAQHNGGFNTQPGHPAHEPLSTVSGTGSQQQVVAASLVRQFGQSVGQGVDEPGPTTVAGGGGKTGVVVAASVGIYHGTEEDGQGADEPSRTATTRSRFSLIEAQQAAAIMLTPEERAGALRVAAFLREHGVEFEGEFAMVGCYVIIDLGMRMLTPRELFRAQGFPESYVIDTAWLIDPVTGAIQVKALTKEQQIRMVGNSVCPPVAEALVRANCPDLCIGHPSLMKSRRRKLSTVTA